MSKTIDEKIKKLLRLASSDNEHEARLAMARARKLMAEYKLDIKDFDESNKKVVELKTDIYWTPYKNSYIGHLTQLIADKYCCVTYSSRLEGSQKRYVTIRGYEEDVEVLKSVLEFAVSCVDSWFKVAKKGKYSCYTNKSLNAIKSTYGRGFAEGLADLLDEQMDCAQQDWGLVMVVPQEAKDFVNGLKRYKVSMNATNDLAISGMGYTDGKNADLHAHLA